MKLPASARLLLDHHKWEFDPATNAYIKDGVALHLRYTNNQSFVVQLSKMSAVWSSIITSEELDQVIRTAKPIKKREN